jgi:ABC-2 type transport system ATP-binding protein
MTFPDIEIKNVKKYFKKVKAVDGVTLTIQKGEFLALLGPNGAGKTTLVEMIEGLQEPDEGSISLMGTTWNTNPSLLRENIGLSLQETRFIDKLTVKETTRLFASFYNIGKERVLDIIKLVGLEEKSKSFVVNLSGGQRQRLALGIALLNNPRLLLLDEPTTGLDPTSRRELWDILLKLKEKEGTTMILTTHYMEEASFLCDTIVILDKGKILARGSLEELLAQQEYGESIQLTSSKKIPENVFNLPGILSWQENNSQRKINFQVRNIVETLPLILEQAKAKNIKVQSIECRKPTLDDLFIKMTGRRLDE